MTTRADVVAAARSLIDTPFHHQQRVPGVGMDCAGVIIWIGWELGLLPRSFDVTGYSRQPDGVTLKAHCDDRLTPIQAEAIQRGDAVLIRWRAGEPQHLGIVADHLRGGLSMIHADSIRQKKVIESRLEFGRYMRLVRAYSFRGVD
jgi:cell wall-associated NlpC family hydrolase